MNCRDFQEMIDSYLSDELLTETNHNVLRHLEDCRNCRKVIESRREVRSHLKTAVINAPQYQIGKNFTHNLQVQLKHEAFKGQEAKTSSRFGFGSWAAVAAGLLLTFTLGFYFIGNSGNSGQLTAAANGHTIANLPTSNLTNIALGDHEFCAIDHNLNEPVTLAQTPAKYDKIENIVMSPLKDVIAECKLVESHTCNYKGTDFTHMVFKNEGKTLSVMITNLDDAKTLQDGGILNYSSEKYQVTRFDLKNEAIFVISDHDKQTNIQVAQALFDPLEKYLYEAKYTQTSFLMFY